MFLNGHFVKAVDISRHTLRGPLSLFGFSTCLKRVIDLALFLSRFKNWSQLENGKQTEVNGCFWFP